MIEIYDDVFDAVYTDYVWGFIMKSQYNLGWEDNTESQYKNIYSHYGELDIRTVGILDRLKESKVSDQIKDKNIVKMVINLAIPGQTFFSHTHKNDWTSSEWLWETTNPPFVCLYYANLKWDREWGGETMFYSMDDSELEKAVEYKPNRVVCFDGAHPHSIRPATFHAPFFRFTASMFFSYK